MSKVEIMSLFGWIFYVSEDYEGIDSSKCGKWMYFFDNKDFAAEICHKAVSDDICQSAKHSDDRKVYSHQRLVRLLWKAILNLKKATDQSLKIRISTRL